MKRSIQGIHFSFAILCIAVLSTSTIMCTAANNFPAAKTVELRQVQRFDTVFTDRINRVIRNRAAGLALDQEDICPKIWKDIWTTNLTKVGVAAIDPPTRLTLEQLQEVRALVNQRVDAAFRAGVDTAEYRDILSAQITADGINGEIHAPRSGIVQ